MYVSCTNIIFIIKEKYKNTKKYKIFFLLPIIKKYIKCQKEIYSL